MKKIMFMAAVARPKYDTQSSTWFSGLIEIWGFTKLEAAKRSSKNREKGTLETKPIASIDNKEHGKMMIENVIPAIKSKWPAAGKNNPIYIQMDNARPHTKAVDKRIEEEGKKGGWNILIKRQPANSPDLNILDLGFLNSIQAIQEKKIMKNIDDLVVAVREAYWEGHINTLDNVWLSLQQSMMGVLEANGDNTKSVKHI
jgi:hypothetical protein